MTIPIPGLAGSIELLPNWRTEAFDFGMSFQSIQDVRLQCSGTITPGLGYRDDTDEWFDWDAEIEINMDPGPGVWAVYVGPYDGSFSEEQSFKQYGAPASWDFLLDGQGEIKARLAPMGTWYDGDIMVVSPTASISEAYLKVDGVPVPEPATLFLLGLGAAFLRKRH